MKMSLWFKKYAEQKKTEKHSEFYRTAGERRRVVDAFIDHSLKDSLMLPNNDSSLNAITFSKALPPVDIKYIYDRTIALLDIFNKKQESLLTSAK